VSKGVHLIVDCHNVPRSTLIDSDQMLENLVEVLTQCGFTVVHQFAESRQYVQGYVAAIVLDESHVTCHTRADDGTMAMDIFTCGDNHPRPVLDGLMKLMNIGTIATREVERLQGAIP